MTTSDKAGQDDRKLLELAAKSAGIDIEFSIFKDESFICFHSGGDCFNSEWNPLLDDGDALRLAVKLGFVIDSHGMWMRVGEPYSDALAHEQKGDDPYAATRRAIVRAAAEIGKTL